MTRLRLVSPLERRIDDHLIAIRKAQREEEEALCRTLGIDIPAWAQQIRERVAAAQQANPYAPPRADAHPEIPPPPAVPDRTWRWVLLGVFTGITVGLVVFSWWLKGGSW